MRNGIVALHKLQKSFLNKNDSLIVGNVAIKFLWAEGVAWAAEDVVWRFASHAFSHTARAAISQLNGNSARYHKAYGTGSPLRDITP